VEYREDIEQLFKNTFDNFESEVHPDAWANIQNGLNIPPAANPASVANNVATGAKVAAVSSKYIIMAVTAIVGITASVVYFSSDKKVVETTHANEVKTVENTLPVVSPVETENKNFSDAVNDKKEAQPVTSNVKADEHATAPTASTQNPSYRSATDENIPVAQVNKKSIEAVTDEKSKEPEIKLQNKAAPTATSVNDEKQKANESLQDVSSGLDADENKDNNVSESKEEKAIEAYLGKIPNVFTPNSDGINDAFVIEGTDLQTLRVNITDRSGKIIHEWNNLHGFWDGKYKNGDAAPSGIYFYNIFAQTKSGLPLTKTGTLHLLQK
jgi:gliding motility-associated-like protein